MVWSLSVDEVVEIHEELGVVFLLVRLQVLAVHSVRSESNGVMKKKVNHQVEIWLCTES